MLNAIFVFAKIRFFWRLKSNVNYFKDQNWHYAILDEGHIIKNPDSQVTKRIKTIQICQLDAHNNDCFVF